MDEARIAQVLGEVVDPAGPTYQKAAKMYANVGASRRILIESQLRNGIAPQLLLEPEFSGSAHYMVREPTSETSFNADQAAAFMLRSLREGHNPTSAVAALLKVLKTRKAEGDLVLCAHGILVKEPIRLTDSITLIPFTDLPDSPQVDWIRAEANRTSLAPIHFHFAPRAALLHPFAISPFVRIHGDGSEPDLATGEHVRAQMSDCLLALVAAGNIRPTFAAAWSQFADSDLHRAASFGVQTQHPELLSFSPPIPSALDAGVAQAVVTQFLSLQEDSRARLRLAMERLLAARLRRMHRDKALELGISLEVLLSAENEGPGEHTHKISTRAARLLGGSLDARIKTRALVRAIYDLRSAAAHTGNVDSKVRVSGEGKQPVQEVLDRGDSLTASLVRALLQAGGLPDWAEYDLGPSDD